MYRVLLPKRFTLLYTYPTACVLADHAPKAKLKIESKGTHKVSGETTQNVECGGPEY